MIWGLIGICIICVYVFYERFALENMRNEVLHDYAVFASFWDERRKTIKRLLENIDPLMIKEKDQYAMTQMLLKRCTRDLADPGFCIGAECVLGIFVHALILSCNAYPSLREKKEYASAAEELKKMHEDEIKLAKRYNETVERYNYKVDHLPSSFVAYIFRFEVFYTYAYDEEKEEMVKAAF